MIRNYFPEKAEQEFIKMSRAAYGIAIFTWSTGIFHIVAHLHMHYRYWLYVDVPLMTAMVVCMILAVYYCCRYLHFYRKQL